MLSVLGATALLCLASLVHASEYGHIHPRSHTHRMLKHRQSEPTTLPGNWSFFGCFTDNPGARTLNAASFVNDTSMSVEGCITFCDSQSFIFAGVEFGQECYCDDIFNNGATNSPLTDCNVACVGNAQEFCGAGGRLDIFWSGATPPPPPITVPSVGLWDSLGCFIDTLTPRTLSVQMPTSGPVTVEACTAACFNAGFPLAGAEFASQCFCDTSINNNSATSSTDCDMVCQGNSSEFCGGPARLNVYNYTGTDLPPMSTVPPGGGGGNTGQPVFPVSDGLPGTWQYVGCFVDGAFGRILTTDITPSPNNTIEVCVATCSAQNFTIAGSEFSDECYCGDMLVEAAVPAPDSDCSMGCAGNTTEACGGPNRLSVYSTNPNVTIIPVPVTQTTDLPGEWQYQGCLAEPPVGGARVFTLYQLTFDTNNSATACLTQCAAFGYPAAGLEFGNQCFCGDMSDVTNNGGGFAPEKDCDFPCTGDPFHLCGGAARISLYYWGGPNGTIDTWHTPEVTGWYEFFVPGVVVPLLAAVGINGKVIFLEKFGTSDPPNSTGAYELDLSLVDQFDITWREMHVKTDVFCSGSIILPDKAARIINVGGWSLDSTFGVRLYAPDGSAGINGTNDWEENGDELKLQAGRWYPTVVLMRNSSILVMGGETGSNGPPQPTLEILPQIPGGNTVMHLDWLDTPNQALQDLYPYLHVLPSGNIFVGYWHQARILDQHTLQTIHVLPDMPSSVNSETNDGDIGGRTYPLEGSSVLFPQHAPYTDPITILICGGSNTGAGQAIDNCISMQPEVKNSTWLLERMPSQRVMPCMAALPDGTFLIVNGAHQGVAGFGLATDPNLNAILYNPSLPLHQRMSILNNTIVARLYHSEATLLPDGRVLISGSDPQDNVHPQEMRVEVYVPPYLATGLKQPTFNINETDWKFGGKYTISNITLFQGNMSALRVSLVAATASTHGNTMGGRTLFPEFSCYGTSCTITAPPIHAAGNPGKYLGGFPSIPAVSDDSVGIAWHQLFILDGPTPSHSTFVRIGGDPAQIGNWPDLPGFNPPGL